MTTARYEMACRREGDNGSSRLLVTVTDTTTGTGAGTLTVTRKNLPATVTRLVGMMPGAVAADLERELSRELAGDERLSAGPVLTCMADVEPREIAWLWKYRMPLGRITLLVGRPGEGKSMLTCDMTARVSTGTPWPDGSECPMGSVLIVSAEDDPGDTIRPRLDAHHADCRRIHLLSAVRRVGADGTPHDVMFTLADVAAMELALQRLRDCKLIIIDPIGSFLGGSTDAHRDNEVRGVLAPVARLAEQYGAAVLVVAHRRKSAGTSADDLALGSRAFTGIARAVWHLSRQSDADADAKSAEQMTGRRSPVRLLLPGKNNLAPEGDGLAFTIAGEPARIIWSRDPVSMSADDALAAENRGNERDERPGPEPEARRAAEDWLAALLAGGAVDAARVRDESQAAGLAWRTVQRAAESLSVVREKNSFSGGWQWRLPRPATEDATEDATSPDTWHPGILASSGFQASNGHLSMTPDEDAKSNYLGIFGPEGGRP